MAYAEYTVETVEVVTASEEEDQFFDDEWQRQRRRLGYWMSTSICWIGLIVTLTIIICLLSKYFLYLLNTA